MHSLVFQVDRADLNLLDAASYSFSVQPPRRLQRIVFVFWETHIKRSSRESHPQGLQGCFRVALRGKKGPAAVEKGRRLSEGLGEVICGGMAGSRIFFKKLSKSTAEDSSAAADRGSEGRR